MSQAVTARHMEVLNVESGASAKTVRAAWRAAVMKSHPDVAGPSSTAQMARINAAYGALKHGVPLAPHMSQWEPVKPGDPAPIHLRCDTRTVSREGQDKWRKDARAMIRKRQKAESKPKSFWHIFKRRSDINLHVPKMFTVTQDKVLVTLDSTELPQGENHIVIPVLRRKGDLLEQTGRLRVLHITVTDPSMVLVNESSSELEDLLLPDLINVAAFISNTRPENRQPRPSSPH